MPKNLGVNTTLADALDVLSVWKTIPDFKMGDVSLNDFGGAVTATDGLAKQHANNAVERPLRTRLWQNAQHVQIAPSTHCFFEVPADGVGQSLAHAVGDRLAQSSFGISLD